MDLLLKIEDIIEQNGSDFELSKLFKQYIKEYKESLPALFEKNQGKDFLVRHTKQLDSIVSLMYKTVLRRSFGNYLPMKSSIPIAIVALGSYGREQLCVYSDIDLLIVYKDVEGYQTRLIIEKLFYLALDAGLKLGHRVHEVSDLFKASKEDITIRTSLMESRFITGSSFTWHSTQRELNSIRKYNPKDFILAKIEEAQIRRKKNPASMQPNIKESVGGLRDSQLLFWIANTLYNVTSMRELSGKLFSEEEYKEYRMALELLFRVRSSLHLITKKQEDRLLLEHIPKVSADLGFKDQKKFASKVLEAQWRINNFTQIFVKKMVRPYIMEPHYIAKFKNARVERGIFNLQGRLYASYNLKSPPVKVLLELLLRLPDREYKFDAGFLRLFTYTEVKYPLGAKIYQLIKQLFEREHMHCFLKLFYDAGILHKLFANFRKVMHLPQFDGYHTYPVDIHSIKCLEALENIKDSEIQKLYNELSKEEKLLIKMVVLFHDTGKGRKQDHSEVGAKLIFQFAKHMKLGEELTNRAVLLVKHHILMSGVAFKENIHNEKVLYKFMSKVEDVTNLKLLYIHTYADINGVSSETFNSFNSKLLHDLYISALEVAQNSDRITDAKKRLNIEKKVQNLVEFKAMPKLLQKKTLNIESNLFFFKHSMQDLINIAQRANEVENFTFRVSSKNSLTIEIIRKIPLNLGFLLASLAHHNVANMEIFTLFDDIKYFRIDFIESVSEDEIVHIESIINNAFDMQKVVKLKEIKIKREEITLDCEHSLTHAELTIQTANQLGLLAYVMDAFEKLKINIVTAKIHSTKYKAQDSFLIDKNSDICNNVEEIYKLLSR